MHKKLRSIFIIIILVISAFSLIIPSASANQQRLNWGIIDGDYFEWLVEDRYLGKKNYALDLIQIQSKIVNSTNFEMISSTVMETEYGSSTWEYTPNQIINSQNLSVLSFNYERIIPLNITSAMIKGKYDSLFMLRYSLTNISSTIKGYDYSTTFKFQKMDYEIVVKYNSIGVLEQTYLKINSEYETMETLKGYEEGWLQYWYVYVIAGGCGIFIIAFVIFKKRKK
jgi:hypothetical protein